jgi:hypothetical protein
MNVMTTLLARNLKRNLHSRIPGDTEEDTTLFRDGTIRKPKFHIKREDLCEIKHSHLTALMFSNVTKPETHVSI